MKKLFMTICLLTSINAFAWDDCGIGEVKLFAGNFAPRNWALANGQLIGINQYPALYSILGTTYGGDGRSTFALPDLQGKVAMGTGKFDNGTEIYLGRYYGSTVVNKKAVKVVVDSVDGEKIFTSIDPRESIVQPSVGMNYIICINGMYPSRS